MAGIVRCAYCANWESSPIHRIIQQNDNDDNDDKKKKKKKKKKVIKRQYRICKVNNRKVKDTTEACRYFKARLYFYCYNSRYWLSLYQCLARRRNRQTYTKNRRGKKDKINYLYPDCTTNCSQFRDDIIPICKKLHINRLGKINQKRIIRKIKRRKVKRQITRR